MRPAQKALRALLSLRPFGGSDCTHSVVESVWSTETCLASRHYSTASALQGNSRTYLLVQGSYTKSFGPLHSPDQQENPAARLYCDSDTKATIPDSGRKEGGHLYMSGSTVTSSIDGDTSEGTSDEEDSEETDTKRRILDAALKHVDSHGWSVDAVRQAASDLQLSPAAASMFDRPEAALVMHFVGKCNKELSEKLKGHERDFSGMQTLDRLRTALQWRLEMLIPVMGTWPQAMAIQFSPGCLPTTLKQQSAMVSDIWYACGDTATDLSWYNKRIILAGIYTQTELYMLTDYSPGYSDTWESLNRRCQDMESLSVLSGKAADSFKQLGKRLGATLGDSGQYLQWAQNVFSEQLRRPR